MSEKRKIGILTGGGDCPGLNAVIRAIVKTLINDYDYEVIGFKDGFKGLVESRFVELNKESLSGILPKGGTILGTTNRDNPFNFPVQEKERVVYKDMSDKAMKNMDLLEVDSLIVIGGDGSLSIAKEFADKGLNVVGIPKTIDNDLLSTDVTFGFNTAHKTSVEAIDKLHTTADSHHRVMILEVMGRYAGWIALESGVSGGADVILIPEIPYDINKVSRQVLNRKNSGKNFSIIVVAEGAMPIDGEMVIKEVSKGRPDPVRLGGIGQVVASQIEEITGIESRVTVLGHLQRGGSPNAYDRLLATRYGVAAARLISRKKYGYMVRLQGTRVTSVPLQDAIKTLKQVNKDGELVRAAKSIGISFGD